jgi:hypothetical protein
MAEPTTTNTAEPDERGRAEPVATVEALSPAPELGIQHGLRPVLTLLAAGIPAAVLAVVLGLWAYDVLVARPRTPVIATVDLQAVVDAKEAVFTEMVAKQGASDQDRQKALDLVAAMGNELSDALAVIKSECGCLLLTKAAVVGQAHLDLTPQLKVRMGVSHVDPAAIRERLRQVYVASPLRTEAPAGAVAGMTK